jgi:TATA-box binding protein (TBP) (component of TFIID and TFIIIB)
MTCLLDSFKEDYLDLNNTYDEIQSMPQEPSPVKITTMTYICDIKQKVDTVEFVKHFKSPAFPVITLKQNQDNGKRTFFNQVTISFVDSTTKAVKIFSNGKLQMCGITSMIESSRTALLVCKLMNTIGSDVVTTEAKPENLYIAMINSSCQCKKSGLNISILGNIIEKLENPQITSNFDPDRYPALKIRYNKQVSIAIFASGNMILATCSEDKKIKTTKRLKHITEAYKNIMIMIAENWDTLKLNIQKPIVKIRNKTITKGYYENEYFCAVSKKMLLESKWEDRECVATVFSRIGNQHVK